MAEAAGPAADNRQARRPGRWDGSYPLHPFLFAAASVLALMTNSLNQAAFIDVAAALSGTFLFALAVYGLIATIRRRADAKAAALASIWMVGCLFFADLFGQLNRMLDGGFSMVRSLPIAFVVLGVLTMIVVKIRLPFRPINTVLNIMALVMVAMPLWQAVGYEWEHGAARAAYDADQAVADMPQFTAGNSAGGASRPPDVYHFIFDRFASEDILAEHYAIDTEPLGRFLEEHGFYVARSSYSNYQKTGHSLASTFYMDYLDGLADDARVQGSNWHPIYEMLDDHRASRFLKDRGYDFLQFGSWWVGTYDNPVADENHPHGFSEFNMLYLRRTILKPLFHILPDTDLTMRLDWDNAQCQRVGDQVEAIKAIGERQRPVYVFSHFLVPHGPYNFTTDGDCMTIEESGQRGPEQGYADQIAYATQIIEEIVTSLQAEGREPPIILIQADEGPFPERDNRVPWQEAPADELRIKTGILNAYYFPNGDYRLLSDDISPVNSYRVLFNTNFGTDFPLLPDRTFAFPGDGTLYEFHDVTEKIRSEDKPVGATAGID